MLISVGTYIRAKAPLSSCLFFHFAASLPAFSSPLHNLHVPFMLQSISSSAAFCYFNPFIVLYNALSCFNQYHQQPHVVILNLFIMHCECHHQSVVLQTSSMQSCSVKSSCLFVIPRLLFPWFLEWLLIDVWWLFWSVCNRWYKI